MRVRLAKGAARAGAALPRWADAAARVAAADTMPPKLFAVFRSAASARDQVALIMGDPDPAGTVPVRLHSACLAGDCCEPFRGDSEAAFPAGVGFVSVYSRSDGIVDWRACLDPAAELVEVDSSHVGMAANASVYRVIAASLEGFRGAQDTAPVQARAA